MEAEKGRSVAGSLTRTTATMRHLGFPYPHLRSQESNSSDLSSW